MIFLLQSSILKRSRAKDPGDFPADKLPGLYLPNLLAERHPPPCSQKLLHIATCSVIGDTAHRHVAPLRECNIQDLRGITSILKEHLVKIPKPEEQEGTWGKFTPHGVILLHHRRCLGSHKSEFQEKNVVRKSGEHPGATISERL